MSPLEVERYVTYPVELSMSGLPHVEEIRSISRFGISLVTVVFQERTGPSCSPGSSWRSAAGEGEDRGRAR